MAETGVGNSGNDFMKDGEELKMPDTKKRRRRRSTKQ